MYSAIDEKDLHFNYVHDADGARIGYQKVCKAEDRPVEDDEIVKAFEWEKGEYVPMRDEDFKAAEAETVRTIDIRDFVEYEAIDPIFFERTYYLGPQENGEKVYALLVKAMDRSGLAAIAKYVMRDKQNLGCLRVREGVITLEKMYFADEIRPIDEITPKDVKVEKAELEMAERLIDSYSGRFQPEKYEDTYRDALCEIINAKRAGKETVATKAPEADAPTDLMAALRASLEATQRRRGRPAGNGGGRDGALDGLTKEELYERAKQADLKGRSQMSRDELVDALRAA